MDLNIWQCADALWVVDVADIRRFFRDASLMEAIELRHLLRRKADGAIRLTSALSCQHGWQKPQVSH